MSTRVYLGFDVGSVSLKTVVLDHGGRILFEDCRRLNGRPFQTALAVLRELAPRFAKDAIQAVGVTGAGGEKLAQVLGGRYVNEIIAQSVGLLAYDSDCRTAIEMGGQDSKLLLFERDGSGGRPSLRDFSMNSLCAAGTGSFLDQQATRLGVSIEEEFGALALRSENPPRIAGRCSVFAKSDMIHLQQIATPVHDIVAGLCLALARSFKSTVGKAKAFERPIVFMGGVASNAGMVRAFETALDLPPGELRIPPHHRTLGAIGAIESLMDAGETTAFRGPEAVEAYLADETRRERKNNERLRPHLTPAGAPDMAVEPIPGGNGHRIPAYLGIDVGSISTNVVVIDRDNRLLAKRYLPTAGRPIEAVQQGLREIGDELGGRVEILGAGATGSGRYLTGELVGADVIRNEITAQATAAILIDPTVDTVFEIGGQDSKYISIDGGAVCDFEMNKACAAGTGSFLEEQAERLGVDLKNEFSPLALDAEHPVQLGDRCTVFMESDLVHYQQQGAGTPDLLAGLSYSIVHNYLNRVVGDRRIGERIFFQGGTAFNKAVVAAFNSVLGKEVIVPLHHEVTGAIGAALLAKDKSAGRSRFRGFDWGKRQYEIKSFTCKACANSCEIRTIEREGDKPLYHGSRCERFDVDRHADASADLPDLFAEREALLLRPDRSDQSDRSDRSDNTRSSAYRLPPTACSKGRVGIPRALSFHEFLPFWRTFFDSLGFEVILSEPTSKAVIHKGVESVISETCFPVKVAHGHLIDLIGKKPDFIFLPSLIDAQTEDFGERDRTTFNCPLIQTIPYTSRSSIDFEALAVKVFSPPLHMQWGLRHLEKTLGKERGLLRSGRREIREALERAAAAQERFREALERRGREILERLDGDRPALVIVSRPYNGCDLGVNLDLPRKLRGLGVLPIPMDMLPLSGVPLPERWRRVYWRYGQRILKAAEIIRGNPHLFAVYVANFSCGPDSFLMEYFRTEMGGKPYLQLEIDEHSGDAGLITRCEAFLDTLENVARDDPRRQPKPPAIIHREFTNHRRIYLPDMSPHAHAMAAAMRANGFDAAVMAPSDDESVRLGARHTSGRECYPCLLTTGDILRQTRRPDFDPGKSAFLMVTADGPCRFGQYNHLHRLVLDKIGLGEVPILTVEQDRDYDTVKSLMGPKFERLAWQGIVAVDALERLLFETRPYETVPGATDRWFRRSLQRVCETMERGGGGFWKTLSEIAAEREDIPREKRGGRPLIGVVGEIYVRMNPFANGDLVKAIEALGGEATVPTMAEWINYVRAIRIGRNREWGRYGRMLGDVGAGFVQRRDERNVYAVFGKKPDLEPAELFEYAAPYLHSSFQGEAILTIGKSVELVAHHGAAGLVNTMPFTCMPGMICAALLKRVQEDYGDVPVLNMAYTGQQETNTRARLEAFVYQARQFYERRMSSRQREK